MADDDSPTGVPFKLWRRVLDQPEGVFAEGTVDDAGLLTITWLAIGQLPDPGSIALDDLLEHLQSGGSGVTFRVELVEPAPG